MTLNNSALLIYCQTCANAWAQDDEGTAYYFRAEAPDGAALGGHGIGDYTSPAAILSADPDARITFCPRCDVELLEPRPIPDAPPGVKGRDPFFRGDDVMVGSDPDGTGGSDNVPDATPPDSDSTAVTHRV